MTGVWALLLDRPLSAQEAAELTALLPPERRERLHRMRLPEKRQEAGPAGTVPVAGNSSHCL